MSAFVSPGGKGTVVTCISNRFFIEPGGTSAGNGCDAARNTSPTPTPAEENMLIDIAAVLRISLGVGISVVSKAADGVPRFIPASRIVM